MQYDVSTDIVIQWLDFYGKKYIRINGDEKRYILDNIDSSGIYIRDLYTNEKTNLSLASACWWRRRGFRHLQLSPARLSSPSNNIPPPHQIEDLLNKYIQSEQSSLIKYIEGSLYQSIPINLGSPTYDLNRLCVLDQARKIGLKTPIYEIITSAEGLQSARDKYGQIVTKAIGDGIYDVVDNFRYYTYTEEVSGPLYENICDHFHPSLIMEQIHKAYEIRSFFIDGDIYSMAIFSQSNEVSRVDYRKMPPPVGVPYQLPPDIEEKLKILYESLGLNTGSSDIIVDKNNNYIFLEINPVGQLGMTSIPCNYNLESKIARYLIDGKI